MNKYSMSFRNSFRENRFHLYGKFCMCPSVAVASGNIVQTKTAL